MEGGEEWMKKKIGIPRGMLYYEFYPMWEGYFSSLNFEVISSPKTNKDILNLGIQSSVDEACLPIKIFHGHVEYLKDKVDYIFVPKIISIYKREYCCPKILGLPDMIKHSIEDLPELIDVHLNLFENTSFKKHFYDIGKSLDIKKKYISNGYKEGIKKQGTHINWLKHNAFGDLDYENSSNNINILLLGHSYNVFDDFMNMGIINKLKDRDIHIFLAEDVSEKDMRYYSDLIPKRIFWTHGRRTIGSAFSLMDRELIDGIIYLSSFGCGLDSILSYIVSVKAMETNIPMMELTLDEQTGEAGFNTRLEAFLDMMKWRDKNEDNIPTFR